MINVASRILKNIFFPGIEDVFPGEGKTPDFAISPVTLADEEPGDSMPRLRLSLTVRGISHEVFACFQGLDDDGMFRLRVYGKELEKNCAGPAGIIFRNAFTVAVVVDEVPESLRQGAGTRMAAVRLLDEGRGSRRGITLLVPLSLLGLLSKDIPASLDAAAVEAGIIAAFREPARFFPDLGVILETFGERELQDLFFLLMQNRLLSVYQLCLIIIAMPGSSLKVKHALSTNTVHDVTEMMKTFRGTSAIEGRDLEGGVYSLEEAIYRLISRKEPLGLSGYLGRLRRLAAEAAAGEIFGIRSFSEWLVLMEEDGLPYHTLVSLPDRVLTTALHGELDLHGELLRRHLSSRRLDDLVGAGLMAPTAGELASARMDVIAAYRAFRIKKRNWGAESFQHLLRCVSEPSGFRRLLLEAGWFTLSTALKGCRPDLVKRVKSLLPRPARFLIEDVLRGVVNPNIIHDELQVNQARELCVRAVLSLYEDGLIELEL